MATGDGNIHRTHPIFATFVGDYPEQLLVTCLKNGDCPTCPVPREELGTGRVEEPRDLALILEALDAVDSHPTVFVKACLAAGIKPVYHPFWEELPYTNIYRSITPDILHQLYQGLIKHLISWLTTAFGPVEIDARCWRMPPNHNLRAFSKGITTLSRVSGQEHRDMCRILMGLIIGLRLPGGQSTSRLLRAVRAMLDFLYLAQYEVHSSQTLDQLDNALFRFHENKGIFVELGVRANFTIPKLHNAGHYRYLIELFGTTDNYNTQATEHLHIEFAKDAYEATNGKDEFTHMTLWLERKEKILRHAMYIDWRTKPPRLKDPIPHIRMTKHPSVRTISFDDIADNYGADDIRNALANFVARTNNPQLRGMQLEFEASRLVIFFTQLSVFHKIRFSNRDPQDWLEKDDVLDVAHAKPERMDLRNRKVPGRFDTVLVNCGKGGETGVKGMYP